MQAYSTDDDSELCDVWTFRFGQWLRIEAVKFPHTTIGGLELAPKAQSGAVKRLVHNCLL